MTTVKDVCAWLNEVAPLSLAEEWDNVGLLLGDDATDVVRAVTCLTLTPDVADEAIAVGARLVITHHPVLFKAVKRLNASTSEGRMILKLMRHGVAVYSPHTAYDNAPTGINQQLAELLGLSDIAPLRTRAAGATGDLVKLVTTVPEADFEAVRQAMWHAGAGAIGQYRDCSFNLRGVGTFLGTEGANPAIGQVGRLEFVDEVRIEVICPSSLLDRAVASLRKAHPYEVPAIDVYPLTPTPDGSGAGRCGRFPQPIKLAELNRLVAERLRQPHVQFVGEPSRRIEKLGIACGAAGEFLRDAARAGCDAFLTGETRFHSSLEARDLNIALILPGHYATERHAMEELARRLASRFSDVHVTASEVEQDPLAIHVIADMA